MKYNRHGVGVTVLIIMLLTTTTNAAEPRKCMECIRCDQPPQIGTSGMVVCAQGCYEVPCENTKKSKATTCDTDGKTNYHQSLIEINQFFYLQRVAIREWLSEQSEVSGVFVLL